MTLASALPPAHVVLDLKVQDKPGALLALARLAGEALGVKPEALAAKLAAREALGSTGVGAGVAVPHARVEGVTRPTAWFVRLARPIDFAAIDGGRVDLLFLLLSPAGDDQGHLAILAAMSRRLRMAGVAGALRSARAAEAAHGLLVG